MKKNFKIKIYLRTGISFLILFLLFAFILTSIQSKNKADNIYSEYQRSFINLKNELQHNSEYFIGQSNPLGLWQSVNNSLSGFMGNMTHNNSYISALIFDKNKNLVTLAGNMLFVEKQQQDTYKSYAIPLDLYLSDEQRDILYSEVYASSGGQTVIASGEVSGFLNSSGQLIPQKIILQSRKDEGENVVFNFDNQPTEKDTAISLKADDFKVYVLGFGRDNNARTQVDEKRLKECEQMALAQLDNFIKNGFAQNGTATWTGLGSETGRTWSQNTAIITIGNERYYLTLGFQAFPRWLAMIELIPIYLFLLFVMLVLFWITSKNFIKIYMKQLALDNSRRDLTNAVAHELKTPLGIIRNYSEGLKENINEEKRDHYLDVIINETQHMDKMVLDMLTIAKLESDYKNLRLIDSSLSKITEAVITRFEKSTQDKGISLHFLPFENSNIKCDPRMIELVITNFLSNAIRYTELNGRINISVGKTDAKNTDSNIRFEIENSGEHIPNESFNHIWDLFYKVDTAREQSEGTGLGLAICKNILDLHGYSYGAENTDTGVKFWFEVK